MITKLPIKLLCGKCNYLHTIKEVKHISLDNKNKQVFLDDMVFSCEICKSTTILILEKD